MGGKNAREGRVELLYKGEWGTICDDRWDINSAKVACRMLGFPRAIAAVTQAKFGRGSGKIWLDDVECQGNEKTLFHCKHRDLGSHNCNQSEDAGVVCETTFRSVFAMKILTRYPVDTVENFADP